MFNELGNVNKFKSSEEERKLRVQDIVRNKYTKNAYLFSEPLDVLIEKAVDKYLYTAPYYNYSYSEINADIDKIISNKLREKQGNGTSREDHERKKMIDLCVEKFYRRFPQFYPETLDELQNKAYDRYIYDEQYKNFDYQQIITELAQDCERRRKKYKTPSTETTPVQETVEELETTPVQEDVTVNNDLNDMVEESTEVKQEITTTNEMEKPKQFVKTDDTSNNQSGSVSIFGIGIALLSIVAFVLVAMILNLLLK